MQVKNQMDNVAEAWKRLQQVLENSEGEWTSRGHMVNSLAVENAMMDLKDEMIQAGILDMDWNEE